MMSEKLDWTEKLGDAVVDQQPDVMDAIQRLRACPGQLVVGRLLGRKYQLERRWQQYQHHAARESARPSDRRRWQ
jgi:hypothetical protein